MKTLVTLLLMGGMLTACGPKAAIGDTRMVYAPARAADCSLTFEEVDLTSKEFNQTWQTLGYISFADTETQDPMAEENRALARPMACDMGGTSVAVAMGSTATNQFGEQGSQIVYIVLRPKPETSSEPTEF